VKNKARELTSAICWLRLNELDQVLYLFSNQIFPQSYQKLVITIQFCATDNSDHFCKKQYCSIFQVNHSNTPLYTNNTQKSIIPVAVNTLPYSRFTDTLKCVTTAGSEIKTTYMPWQWVKLLQMKTLEKFTLMSYIYIPTIQMYK